MIHSALSKLKSYAHSTHFTAIMDEITACQNEGLDNFELDVLYLTPHERQDLMNAFIAMSYSIEYNEDEEMLQVFSHE